MSVSRCIPNRDYYSFQQRNAIAVAMLGFVLLAIHHAIQAEQQRCNDEDDMSLLTSYKSYAKAGYNTSSARTGTTPPVGVVITPTGKAPCPRFLQAPQ